MQREVQQIFNDFAPDIEGAVAENEEVTVTPGTVILIPAGENYYHGAAKDSVSESLVPVVVELMRAG